MINLIPNRDSDGDPIPLEPDFNWLEGKKRTVLPSTKLRAIPLIGMLVGLGSAFFAKSLFPSNPTLLFIGIFLGGGIGFVIYQVLAHRATQAGESKKQ